MRMRRCFDKRAGAVLIMCAIGFACPRGLMAQAKVTSVRAEDAPSQTAGNGTESPFMGTWTYRSFISDPKLSTPANNLLFGSGTLVLTVPTPDRLSGTLGGDGWSLMLKGGVTDGNPATIRFQGKGTIGGEEWIYDYLGYLVPVWPNGENQRPAIVGTIVRTKAHSDGHGGIAPAGVVAQWIAVKQDVAAGSTGAGPEPSQAALKPATSPAAAPSGARSAPPQAGGPAEQNARSIQRLREMYENQDEVERLREKDHQTRAVEARANSALRVQPPRTPANVAPPRANFQPKPSLNPVTYSSENKRLDLTLNLTYSTFTIGKDQVRLRTYNSNLIGPALKLKAGDTLYITLINELPLNPLTPHEVNGHHEWNTTNLHFHGLHVAPQGPKGQPESDNVLLELKPSSPFDPRISVQKYAVHIPPDHPAGTFWYHAHKHGAVAAQVSSGLAGALIIDRDDNITNLDSIAEIKAAAQEIVVLQQIPYLSNVTETFGGIEPTSVDDINTMFGPGQWAKLKRYTLVNDLRIPTITIAPGEVRRFRFVDTGQRELIQLQIEPSPISRTPGNRPLRFREIALDGLATGSIPEADQIELYPGYRSDALIQPPIDASGDYYLVDASLPDKGATGADGSPELVRWIAKIVVSGPPVAMALPRPEQLVRQRLKDLRPAEVTGTQYAFYGIDFPPNATNFLVSRADLSETTTPVNLSNASPYNPSDARLLTLGKTQRWLIGSRNGSTSPGGNPLSITHPFHIHINPFLITRVTKRDGNGTIDVTADEIGRPVWRDTLAMKQGYTYELLTQYATFAGSFVDHCHILDHEDSGMMELVTIFDPKAKVGARAPAPATGSSTNRISAVIPQSSGKPAVLLFVKGAFCQHCMIQLVEMATKLSTQDVVVSVISASTEADLLGFPLVPFTLVADPDLKIFRKYGVFDGETRHATIVIDPSGKEVLRNVGKEPLMDATAVTKSLNQAPPGSRAMLK
jgi:FtsP/CotA-like multicopper oxidase with cupredoxin domain/peroxiredoxin